METELARLNDALAVEGKPPLAIGIGLNTGPSYVGLMGSSDRLSYTCMGDSVTLAARLEGLTRIYGVPNCVGEDVVADMPRGLAVIELDRVSVKGRARPVTVFTVLEENAPGADSFANLLATARAHLRARRWDEAEAAVHRLAALETPVCDTTHLAAEIAARIELYRQAPPPPDWDGTFTARSKR